MNKPKTYEEAAARLADIFHRIDHKTEEAGVHCFLFLFENDDLAVGLKEVQEEKEFFDKGFYDTTVTRFIEMAGDAEKRNWPEIERLREQIEDNVFKTWIVPVRPRRKEVQT